MEAISRRDMPAICFFCGQVHAWDKYWKYQYEDSKDVFRIKAHWDAFIRMTLDTEGVQLGYQYIKHMKALNEESPYVGSFLLQPQTTKKKKRYKEPEQPIVRERKAFISKAIHHLRCYIRELHQLEHQLLYTSNSLTNTFPREIVLRIWAQMTRLLGSLAIDR